MKFSVKRNNSEINIFYTVYIVHTSTSLVSCVSCERVDFRPVTKIQQIAMGEGREVVGLHYVKLMK